MNEGESILTGALWLSAIGSGIVAGLFFGFSTFIMRALAALPRAAGISAMQSINVAIQSSLFMPVFFGSAATSLAVAGFGLVRWGEPGSALWVSGGAVYVVGMFLCTVQFNVPLNQTLDRVEPASSGADAVWSRYLRIWTFWNHVRTVASVVACGLFIAAIARATQV